MGYEKWTGRGARFRAMRRTPECQRREARRVVKRHRKIGDMSVGCETVDGDSRSIADNEGLVVNAGDTKTTHSFVSASREASRNNNIVKSRVHYEFP